MRGWIERYKPLSRVQEELDHVEPLAQNLYNAAEGYYRSGKLDKASSLLQEALAANPNHLKASELLAEILLSQGELDGALGVLEKLHENYPAVARPRLVDILLTQALEAKAQGNRSVRNPMGPPHPREEARLELYERVLKLDPRNAAALEGKRDIGQIWGDRLVAEGRLDEAEKTYRDAGLEEQAAGVGERLRKKRLEELRARVAGLESSGQYAEAIEVIGEGGRDFPDWDWEPDRERLERAVEMEGHYQRAVGALASDDRETAKQYLGKVIAVKPVSSAKLNAPDLMEACCTALGNLAIPLSEGKLIVEAAEQRCRSAGNREDRIAALRQIHGMMGLGNPAVCEQALRRLKPPVVIR